MHVTVVVVVVVVVVVLLLEVALGLRLPAAEWNKQQQPSASFNPRLQRLLHRSYAVALTREQGTNDALRQLLHGIECVELPCLEFADLMNPSELGASIPNGAVVLLTSPQAAKVFLRGWAAVNKPPVQVVSVGSGTTKQLLEEGLRPEFEPTQALGAVLAKELPAHLGANLWYCASLLADDALVKALRERGFQVTRQNAYTTQPTTWTAQQLSQARDVHVVALASPSAADSWTRKLCVSPQCPSPIPAVAIGPTTAEAARRLGFDTVFCPDRSSGLEAWAQLVRQVATPSSPPPA